MRLYALGLCRKSVSLMNFIVSRNCKINLSLNSGYNDFDSWLISSLNSHICLNGSRLPRIPLLSFLRITKVCEQKNANLYYSKRITRISNREINTCSLTSSEIMSFFGTSPDNQKSICQSKTLRGNLRILG